MFDNDFDRRFKRQQRTFDIMFRIISVFVAIVFVAIVTFWIVAGTFAVKAVDQIDQHGVKGIVEQIWCGKENPSCLQQK